MWRKLGLKVHLSCERIGYTSCEGLWPQQIARADSSREHHEKRPSVAKFEFVHFSNVCSFAKSKSGGNRPGKQCRFYI